MKRLLLFFSILLISLSGLIAQSKTERGWIQFTDSIHDFGTIEELGGAVVHEFRFINAGKTDLTIEKVRASCGCTTPGWTETVVAPGDSGYVQARFDPSNRPGPFEKMLYVTSNAENYDLILYIKGNVQPRPRTPADDYPIKMGGLRFRSRVINAGKVLSNEAVSRSTKFYNDSEQNLFFKDNIVSPEYINVRVSPDTLAPGETGLITVIYDPVKRNDLGYSKDQIAFFSNESEESQKMLSVVATVEEYFPPMTESERAEAPKIRIEPTFHDFGSMKEGDSLDFVYTLTNEGKSELNIRKLKSNCDCTITSMESENIAPGAQAELSVKFDSTGKIGYQYKTITIFTNDPSKPTHVVSFKGKVQKAD